MQILRTWKAGGRSLASAGIVLLAWGAMGTLGAPVAVAQEGASSGSGAAAPAAAQPTGAAGAAAAGPASQLTAEALIGNLVDDLGPKYHDIEDGIDLFLKGDFSGARNAVDRSVKENPQLPPTSMIMARMYMMANNAKETQAELERAAVEAPNDPEGYIIQGDIALQRSENVQANAMYEKGLEKAQSYASNPKRKNLMLSRAYSGLAFVKQAASDWTGSEKQLREWLKIVPDDNNARERLAYVLFRQGTADSKKAAYVLFGEIWKSDQANRLRPEIAMARLFDQVDKDLPRAKNLMSQAQEKDPGLQTQLAVAQWALEANEMELAKKASDAANAADAKSLEGRLIAGLLDRYNGRDADALKKFIEAHLQSPMNPIALNQIALILINSDNADDRKRAVEFAQIGASVYNRFEQNYARESALVYAWVLHKMGRPRDAGQIVKTVLEKPGAVDSASLYFAAEILHKMGQDEPAKKILDAILSPNKNFLNRDKATDLRKSLG